MGIHIEGLINQGRNQKITVGVEIKELLAAFAWLGFLRPESLTPPRVISMPPSWLHPCDQHAPKLAAPL